MTIGELINKLKVFPSDQEVVVCDNRSHQYHMHGDINVVAYECENGNVVIEVGNCKRIVDKDDVILTASDCDDERNGC